jgi:hypothetical protein
MKLRNIRSSVRRQSSRNPNRAGTNWISPTVAVKRQRAFVNACRLNCLATVRSLLKLRNPPDPNVTSQEDPSNCEDTLPSYIGTAIKMNNIPLMKILLTESRIKLQLEKFIRLRSGERGGTPLQLAAVHGRLEIARLLLEAGCDVNFPGGSGHKYRTPLMIAVMRANVAMCELLLCWGSDVNDANRSPEWLPTPLAFAVFSGHGPLVQVLLQYGPTMDEQSVSLRYLWPKVLTEDRADILELLCRAMRQRGQCLSALHRRTIQLCYPDPIPIPSRIEVDVLDLALFYQAENCVKFLLALEPAPWTVHHFTQHTSMPPWLWLAVSCYLDLPGVAQAMIALHPQILRCPYFQNYITNDNFRIRNSPRILTLLDSRSTPQTLRSQCMRKVYTMLGKDADRKIQELPLPRDLLIDFRMTFSLRHYLA